MDNIQIGPFTLQYLPASVYPHSSGGWAMPAHWYVDGTVGVTGATPEECVLRLRNRLLKTFLSLTGTTPELLDRAEQLIAQVETLEEWLQGRASQEGI